MDKSIEINKIYLPFTSRGIVSVLLNLLYLLRYRKGYFHITGDIHYALLVLPKDNTILTIHDLVFLHTYKGLRRRILKWIFLDMPIRKAKYITTISEKSKQEIIDFTHCDPDKILVIPNPVTIGKEGKRQGEKETIDKMQDAIGNRREAVGNRLEVKGLDFEREEVSSTFSTSSTLLFLGTKKNKNLEMTIAALFGLDVHLRIIGELSYSQLELLKKFRINYSNVFNLSDETLENEYKLANIILFPSTYEGFGLPVIEGFQSNRPVITSNISPMKDIALGAALLVDPFSIASIRDGILTLLKNKNLQLELSLKGNEIVKNYQPEYIAGIYADLWRKIVL